MSKDLSNLAENSMWPTSQSAGNMMSSSKNALTAPGSKPVNPLPPAKEQGDPHVSPSDGPEIKPGHHGTTPPRSGAPGSGPPAWKKTSTA